MRLLANVWTAGLAKIKLPVLTMMPLATEPLWLVPSPNCSLPLPTVVPPVYVFEPVRINVPAPPTERLPADAVDASAMTPA